MLILYERQHGLGGFFGCDRMHASKIERALAQKAGAAFHLVAEDRAGR